MIEMGGGDGYCDGNHFTYGLPELVGSFTNFVTLACVSNSVRLNSLEVVNEPKTKNRLDISETNGLRGHDGWLAIRIHRHEDFSLIVACRSRDLIRIRTMLPCLLRVWN